MNKITLIVLSIVLVAIGFYLIAFTLPFKFFDSKKVSNDSRCWSREKAINENITGLVTGKFLDNKSHMWETIEYTNKKGPFRSTIFLNDHSGTYDFIVVGDSILKRGGGLEFVVIRKGKIKKFQLDYKCE